LGKALLAYQSDQYIEEYISTTDFKNYTKMTITDPEKLWQEIRTIRERGYAQNLGERYDDIGAVGVPIIQKEHAVDMAVCLTYPQHVIYDKTLIIEDLIQMVQEISSEISKRLVSPDRTAD
jgi:DNA-binding IclR family transcriptional regulator